MMATADLPPGARGRIWILLAVTLAVGVLTWWAFGRVAILWVSGLAFVVLVYLLAGVELTLRRERERLAPLVSRVLAGFEPEDALWMVLSSNGTVLHLTDEGQRALRHDPHLLIGQRLGDLVPTIPPGSRVAFSEMLRFATANTPAADGGPWSGDFSVVTQHGSMRVHRVRVLPIGDTSARTAGLIALTGEVMEERLTGPLR